MIEDMNLNIRLAIAVHINKKIHLEMQIVIWITLQNMLNYEIISNSSESAKGMTSNKNLAIDGYLFCLKAKSGVAVGLLITDA